MMENMFDQLRAIEREVKKLIKLTVDDSTNEKLPGLLEKENVLLSCLQEIEKEMFE